MDIYTVPTCVTRDFSRRYVCKLAPWMRADVSKFSAMNFPNRDELSLRT